MILFISSKFVWNYLKAEKYCVTVPLICFLLNSKNNQFSILFFYSQNFTVNYGFNRKHRWVLVLNLHFILSFSYSVDKIVFSQYAVDLLVFFYDFRARRDFYFENRNNFFVVESITNLNSWFSFRFWFKGFEHKWNIRSVENNNFTCTSLHIIYT